MERSRGSVKRSSESRRGVRYSRKVRLYFELQLLWGVLSLGLFDDDFVEEIRSWLGEVCASSSGRGVGARIGGIHHSEHGNCLFLCHVGR